MTLPDAHELQAHADNLRDMLAGGALDPMIVRRAANALEAMGRLRPVLVHAVGFLDEEITPAPIGPPIETELETYELSGPSREGCEP